MRRTLISIGIGLLVVALPGCSTTNNATFYKMMRAFALGGTPEGRETLRRERESELRRQELATPQNVNLNVTVRSE